jgi:hypothetical protein
LPAPPANFFRTCCDIALHVHLLVDLAGADPQRLGRLLRAARGAGSRQVQIKVMQQRAHRANIIRLAHYMTRARYTRDIGDHREWLSNEEIVTVAMWRDRLPAQWHRFTWGVRGVELRHRFRVSPRPLL